MSKLRVVNCHNIIFGVCSVFEENFQNLYKVEYCFLYKNLLDQKKLFTNFFPTTGNYRLRAYKKYVFFIIRGFLKFRKVMQKLKKGFVSWVKCSSSYVLSHVPSFCVGWDSRDFGPDRDKCKGLIVYLHRQVKRKFCSFFLGETGTSSVRGDTQIRLEQKRKKLSRTNNRHQWVQVYIVRGARTIKMQYHII